MKRFALLIPVAAIVIAMSGVMMFNASACSVPGAIDGSVFRDNEGQCRLHDVPCAERLVRWVSGGGHWLIIPKFSCRIDP